jgi:hypothetical protein
MFVPQAVAIDIDKEEEALAAGLDHKALTFNTEAIAKPMKTAVTIEDNRMQQQKGNSHTSRTKESPSTPPLKPSSRVGSKPISPLVENSVTLNGVDSIVVCHEQPDLLSVGGGGGGRDGRKMSSSSQSMSI